MGLVSIGDGESLLQAPAASFERMCAEAGRRLEVTSAYRSAAEQQYWYDGWVARKVGFNFALPPDKSDHVKGIAIDTPEYSWMEKNANKHGWYRTDSRERWHYVYFPARDTMLKLTPLKPIAKKEPQMRIIQGYGSPHVYITDGVTKRHIQSEEELPDLYRLCDQDKDLGPVILGMYVMDRIPVYQPPAKAVDLSRIESSLRLILERELGVGATPSEVAAEVLRQLKAAL